MSGDSYMEIIYIDDDGNGCQTNVRSAHKTNAQTWAAFNSYRKMAVESADSRFVLDYHNAKGDLADTILLDAFAFEAITRQKAKTDREYRKIDADYWTEVRREYDASRKVAA